MYGSDGFQLAEADSNSYYMFKQQSGSDVELFQTKDEPQSPGASFSMFRFAAAVV